MRNLLLRLSSNNHFHIQTMHHIIGDAWSLGILTRELEAFYGVFAGVPTRAETAHPPLPELPVQYADFACWQQRILTAGLLERQRDYWVRQLADLPSLLPLPTDRPRPKIQKVMGRHQPFQFDEDLSRTLHRLSKQNQASMFMCLKAAFNCLLSRYCRRTDITVGSPIANRNHKPIENLVGSSSTHGVSKRPFGKSQFTAYLNQERKTALDAYANQDFPFEKWWKPFVRKGAWPYYAPLPDHVHPGQHQQSRLKFPGLSFGFEKSSYIASKFDLSLVIKDDSRGIQGFVEYNSHLFFNSTVQRLHFPLPGHASGDCRGPRPTDLPVTHAHKPGTGEPGVPME